MHDPIWRAAHELIDAATFPTGSRLSRGNHYAYGYARGQAVTAARIISTALAAECGCEVNAAELAELAFETVKQNPSITPSVLLGRLRQELAAALSVTLSAAGSP